MRRLALGLIGALSVATGVGVMLSAHDRPSSAPAIIQQGGSPVPHNTGGTK